MTKLIKINKYLLSFYQKPLKKIKIYDLFDLRFLYTYIKK
jgi:hypothetical protein